MAIIEDELKNQLATKSELEQQQFIRKLLFEFFDTLCKIKQLKGVSEIYFIDCVTDIFVVTSVDDVDLSDKIIQKFAQWEATYHIFPELHIITKEECYFIPNGALKI